MERIFLLEDDEALGRGITMALEGSERAVFRAGTLAEAEEILSRERFSLLILDVNLPDGSGLELLKQLRQRGDSVPVILLTANDLELDIVAGLELGADDYITKPFSLSLLYAKVTALIRRDRGGVLTGDTLRCGDLEVSLSSRRVRAGGRELSLTPKEYALLTCLMRNRNMVMSREQLLVKCWGYDYEGESRAVDTHIRRLREKLGPYGTCIKTVIKAGYKLEG